MNSKGVGNSYEREFSKKLSLWVSNNTNDDLFWRDLSSGARFTSRKKQGKDTCVKGDIVAVDLIYKEFTDLFFIDTKSYSSINLLFTNFSNLVSNGIFQQWLKVNNDCPSSMIPFMPVKIRDRKTPEFIIFPITTKFHSSGAMLYDLIFKSKRYSLWLILQDDFFVSNDWRTFMMENKKI